MTTKEEETVRTVIRDGDAPVRHWLASLISPQTLVVIVIAISGSITAWVTIQTRISENAVTTAQLQKALDKLEIEVRQHQRDEEDIEIRKQAEFQRTIDTDNQRLWQDINELRRRIESNTLLIGQVQGAQGVKR